MCVFAIAVEWTFGPPRTEFSYRFAPPSFRSASQCIGCGTYWPRKILPQYDRHKPVAVRTSCARILASIGRISDVKTCALGTEGCFASPRFKLTSLPGEPLSYVCRHLEFKGCVVDWQRLRTLEPIVVDLQHLKRCVPRVSLH